MLGGSTEDGVNLLVGEVGLGSLGPVRGDGAWLQNDEGPNEKTM